MVARRQWAMTIGMCVLAIMLAVGFNVVWISHEESQQRSAEHAAQTAIAAQQHTQLKNTCTIIDKLRDKYTSLNTPGALGIADVWAQLYGIIGCATVK